MITSANFQGGLTQVINDKKLLNGEGLKSNKS